MIRNVGLGSMGKILSHQRVAATESDRVIFVRAITSLERITELAPELKDVSEAFVATRHLTVDTDLRTRCPLVSLTKAVEVYWSMQFGLASHEATNWSYNMRTSLVILPTHIE